MTAGCFNPWNNCDLRCRPKTGTSRFRAAALVMAAALTTAAHGQYLAGGGGNPLAGGLDRSNGLASQGRDFAAEAKYRNSIVFGNAPGGFSFRGRLGYSDPSDFVGRLGSSTLNNFRRNSELSTIASQGLRRDQVFDSQNALTTGGLSRRYQPGRGDVNFNAFNTPRSSYSQRPLGAAVGAAVGSLSDSSLARITRGSVLRQDAALDRSYNLTNKLGRGLGASSTQTARVSGLVSGRAFSDTSRTGDLAERLGQDRTTSISKLDFGRTDYGVKLEGERTLANSARARGQAERVAGDAQRSRTKVDAERPGSAGTSRIDTSARASTTDLFKTPTGGSTALGDDTSYDDLRRKLDKRGIMGGTTPELPSRTRDEKTPGAAPDRTAVPGSTEKPGATAAPGDWQARINDLRMQLLRREGPARSDRLSLIDRTKVPARPGEKPEGKPDERPAGRSEQAGADEKSLRTRIDPETLKMIKDVSGRVDKFVSTEPGRRDFYSDHMKAGQQLLADRMYFDAEERFARALSMKPADVAARTGRIHAQIGAGLALSAGQQLRQLLAEHPETAGQRYAESLRPDAERTERVVEQLRNNVAGTGKLRRESALLIAYLGFQSSNPALAREGLDAMAQVAGEDPGAGSDERLVELLRGVWLDPKLYETPGERPAAPGAPK